MTPLLSVENLSIGFGHEEPVVQDVNFSVSPGETIALVGESGSGKTISCRAVLRILPKAAQIRSGKMIWRGTGGAARDLRSLPERQMRDLRGQ